MLPHRLLALLLGVIASVANAAGPGVPVLQSQPDDFVRYAVTDAPDWFKSGQMAAANNTPADNPITNAGAELGRVLFYDPRLSINLTTSCASCHVQANAFDDPNVLSIGFDGGLTGRHSMALSNAAYYRRGGFFWDERAPTLEAQVLMPIEDLVEMGETLPSVVTKLEQTEFYPVLFQRAFGSSQITTDRMSRAMAQFVRAMVSYQSPYDRARAAGDPNLRRNVPGAPRPDVRANLAAFQQALAAESVDGQLAAQGHQLFQQNCQICHREDAQILVRPINVGLDATNDLDPGTDRNGFKVPSLRNAMVRGAFMHDGRFETMEEVMEFYATGVQPNPALGPSLTPPGNGLNQQEQQALVAFMRSLTDEAFLTNPIFSDPFADLPGDYNGDGVVDTGDRDVWQDLLGLTTADVNGPLLADGNNDGVVDGADRQIWRANRGARWDDGL